MPSPSVAEPASGHAVRRRSGTRANPATCACFFDAAQPPYSVPHTLFCSITPFVASSLAPPLQFCQPCTRPHPAECALGLPCPCRQRRAHSSKTLFHKTRRARRTQTCCGWDNPPHHVPRKHRGVNSPTPQAKPPGMGSPCLHTHAGACGGRHTVDMHGRPRAPAPRKCPR